MNKEKTGSLPSQGRQKLNSGDPETSSG